jgi:hypothetical protein
VKSVVAVLGLWCVVLTLAACSGGSTAAGHSPAEVLKPAGDGSAGTRKPVAGKPAAPGFTVAGNLPVPPNGSQDTHAQTPGAVCDGATFASDEATGTRVADGFALAGYPVAAGLLQHFLTGTGTAVGYGAGSEIAREARQSGAFQAVNDEVQAAVSRQLAAGRTLVRLSAGQLTTVAFETTGSDLYWGFRGTQGLTVTGRGSRVKGRYTGTLTYVIRDSYGFPAGDTLDGFGPPMRYLQTVCGAPQHGGGARWFPDTITVTVPFSG